MGEVGIEIEIGIGIGIGGRDRGEKRTLFKFCGEAATTTLGLKGRQTLEPSGRQAGQS